MDVYLSGISGVKKQLLSGELDPTKILTLESFYSIKNWEIPFIHKFEKFLLDSGAFTFRMAAKDGKIETRDWERYACHYADFVKQNGVDYFFELDIDNVVGYETVKKLRTVIERRSGKQSIPVWHTNRGKDDYIRMCEEYPYVAIGGLVGKSVFKIDEKYFPWFIDVAHNKGCKIHGLGYTKTERLNIYSWDSVDSTTWASAGRFGEVHYFNGNRIQKEISVVKGVKIRSLRDPSATTFHNFKEWVKFSQYAKNRL